MATANLSATRRSGAGKGVARSLRASGRVPGVIYGHGRQPEPLAIETRALEKLLERTAAATTVIELELGGIRARTLIREIQRHPYKRELIHIDFQELVAGEKVTVHVPIVLVGTPEGVRAGGILDQVMRDVEIEVDPGSIPNHIDVDVNVLTIGHSIHVSDLKLAEGIEIISDPEATICVVTAPKAVVEETPVVEGAAPEAAPEPELIRKPKDEEEGEEPQK